jgi:hypothetical protein
MIERPEWEVVDSAPTRPPPSHVLEMLLGRHWRWKVGGFAVLASGLLILLLTVMGAVMVILVVGAFVTLAIGKVTHWLRDKRVSNLPCRK